jgi:hypothetical protein
LAGAAFLVAAFFAVAAVVFRVLVRAIGEPAFLAWWWLPLESGGPQWWHGG